MAGLRVRNWKAIIAIVAVIALVGLVSDWLVRLFAYHVKTKSMDLTVSQLARQWDNFFEFAARSITFQQTFNTNEILLDPKRREQFILQSGNWLNEMRNSVRADFWVINDAEGKPVVSSPLEDKLPNLRSIWEVPFHHYPCRMTVLADANGEPSFIGIETDIVIKDKKRGEILLLYAFNSLAQSFFAPTVPFSLRFADREGNVIARLSQLKPSDEKDLVNFVSELKELPMLLIASVPKGILVEDATIMRFLVWDLLILIALLVIWIMGRYRKISGGEFAVKLTEIFQTLSEHFIETQDSQRLFQVLAEAFVREFQFSLAMSFRYDKQTKNFILAGYAPTHIIRRIMSQAKEGSDKEEPKLVLPTSVIEQLESKVSVTSILPDEVRRALQTALHLRNYWCKLLYVEGQPMGLLIIGTSKEQFSDEELQLLELARQQMNLFLEMVLKWEERKEAEKRTNRFQETLIRLTKNLPQEQDLTAKLNLIAQEVCDALQVSRVNIWQVTPDQRYIYCLAAVGEGSEKLIGTLLPIKGYVDYLASLDKERVVAVSSVLDDPRTKELSEDYWLPHGIKSTMDAPVKVEGRMVGIICCEHKTERNWSSDEIAFAGSASDFVARALLEFQQKRREQYLSKLSQIALQMLIAMDWESVLPILLEDIGKLSEADKAFVAQVVTDEKGQRFFKCLDLWSIDEYKAEQSKDVCPFSEAVTPEQIKAIEAGEPVFVLVETLPEPYRKFYESREINALLAVPIFVESRWWGVLGLSARKREKHWDDVDIAISRITASLLGSIIERQKATERQIEQERQFRELVENANVGIYRVTPDGRFLLVNSALAQMFGYETPEKMIASVTNIVEQHLTDPRKCDEFMQMIAERGFVENFIVSFKRRDGEIFWASISGRGVYDREGNLLYYEGFIIDITARILAEEQIARRLEQLQTLYRLTATLNQATDLETVYEEALKGLMGALKADRASILLFDSDGVMRFKAWYGLSEQYRKAVEGHSPWSLDEPEPKPITILDVAKADELGELRQVVLKEGIRALMFVPLVYQGKLMGKFMAYFNTPHQFSNDEVQLAQAIANHIAFAIVRNQAEEQLRRSEKDFRNLFENAVVGVYRSTPEGHFLMANETQAKIHGYESVEELMMIDIPTQIYLNPEDRERFKQLMVEQGFVTNFRYPIKRKDGSIAWLAKWARAVKDDEGNVLYYEGFILDITEQVQLEQKLQALQEITRSLVMRLDIDSIVQVAISSISQVYPNSAVLLFRYQEDKESFILERANEGASDLMEVLGLRPDKILKRQAIALLEGKIWSGEGILLNDFTSTIGSLFQRLYQLNYQSLFLRGIGDSTQLWGVMVVFRKGAIFSKPDIMFLNSFCDYLSVAIKNAVLFQQVRQAYDELQTFQERTLEQERLRALGQIASGIAHDINNALVPIQGFAEMMFEHSDPVIRNVAETIFKSARDIATTIQRMREFYRPRTQQELPEPMDLNAICKDAWEMTRPRWFNMPLERGIVIQTKLDLAKDLPPLMGTPSEIRQAIINLIINAVDAMPEGGTLTIRTYRQEKMGRAWAVVEVEDTGVGMDEETKRRAIEPFFTTKGERGSGLGLSTVYGTVQRHEGFMEIESELGKGTKVRLWLPSSSVKFHELPSEMVPSLKLLVIDDEPSVRETVALLLRRNGHIVVTAASGEEGLEIFRNSHSHGNPFNVVITDLGMPKMDGITVGKEVKKISPKTPVILLSGWGFKVNLEEIQDAIDIVLTKPVNSQQIQNALHRIWSEHQKRQKKVSTQLN